MPPAIDDPDGLPAWKSADRAWLERNGPGAVARTGHALTAIIRQ